ncbi:MAG: hypothetical protein RLZZ298_1533 [Pseudomonadota bacterium]|jgi:hypothetical protein
MAETTKEERPQERAFGRVQALSSRIPPVRAVAVSGNLYKSHACLREHHRPDRGAAPVGPGSGMTVYSARSRTGRNQILDWVPIKRSDFLDLNRKINIYQ